MSLDNIKNTTNMRLFQFFKFTIALCLLVLISSCNKWVDLPPKDRITDKVLFSTKEGFLKALNGVYSELNNNSLYGKDLTAGMIDVMAQYYNTSLPEHNYAIYAKYEYSNQLFKDKLNAIWSISYRLIANSNAILDKCEEQNGVLPANYYGIVKGEALALRAMLHFDLLRMYGPIYSSGKDTKCIPYMESSDRSVKPLLSAEEVLSKVISDLKAAKELLKDSDPVLTSGPQNFPGPVRNDMNYRQYRLNYFAVTALLARASLWGGDKENAVEYAKEVINKGQVQGNSFFPFVTLSQIRPGADDRVADRVFSSEVLFAGYNSGRQSIYSSLFSPSLNVTNLLTFPGSLTEGRVERMYDNQNDYRRGMWATSTVEDREVTYFNKYEDLFDKAGLSNAFRYMLPLIRISEMHLLIAECSSDFEAALGALNAVRTHRGLTALELTTLDEVQQNAYVEFTREFLGEGQLFFYFKRKGYTNLPDGNRIEGGVTPMQLINYVFPLPESETSQRL